MKDIFLFYKMNKTSENIIKNRKSFYNNFINPNIVIIILIIKLIIIILISLIGIILFSLIFIRNKNKVQNSLSFNNETKLEKTSNWRKTLNLNLFILLKKRICKNKIFFSNNNITSFQFSNEYILETILNYRKEGLKSIKTGNCTNITNIINNNNTIFYEISRLFIIKYYEKIDILCNMLFSITKKCFSNKIIPIDLYCKCVEDKELFFVLNQIPDKKGKFIH